jgi:catechol 2,3-dioxygenase
MVTVTRPTPTHFGLYVTDHPRMVAFYAEVFDLSITDRGQGRTFRNDLVFMSASAEQHHQLVIASGRPPGVAFSTVMQLSFAVPSLQHLREIRARAEARGASQIRGLNHGNAISVYMADPEGNTVEVYLDTPWYVAQPHGDPLDLSLSDDELMRQTEAICRADPSFMPLADWQAQFNGSSRPSPSNPPGAPA